MRPTVWILAFSILSAGSSFAQKELTERLSEEHRGWLERDVLYIITEREREVFQSLETLEERNSFIEAFWRKRDPNPTTQANEFRDEHDRRIEYANKAPGQGNVPRRLAHRPRALLHHFGGTHEKSNGSRDTASLMDSELWFYQGEEGKLLPAFFYLLFYKRGDVGEYEELRAGDERGRPIEILHDARCHPCRAIEPRELKIAGPRESGLIPE